MMFKLWHGLAQKGGRHQNRQVPRVRANADILEITGLSRSGSQITAKHHVKVFPFSFAVFVHSQTSVATIILLQTLCEYCFHVFQLKGSRAFISMRLLSVVVAFLVSTCADADVPWPYFSGDSSCNSCFQCKAGPCTCSTGCLFPNKAPDGEYQKWADSPGESCKGECSECSGTRGVGESRPRPLLMKATRRPSSEEKRSSSQ